MTVLGKIGTKTTDRIESRSNGAWSQAALGHRVEIPTQNWGAERLQSRVFVVVLFEPALEIVEPGGVAGAGALGKTALMADVEEILLDYMVERHEKTPRLQHESASSFQKSWGPAALQYML
jgi:hypothetical protein